MATIGIIGLILGIIFFFIAVNSDSANSKAMRNGAIIMFIGGLISGCFATPSSDMPDGMPGAAAFGIVMVLYGGFSIFRAFKPAAKKDDNDQTTTTPKKASRLPLIITIVVFVVMLIVAFGSSSGSSNKNQPWKELGVSESEYKKVYNHYKYGTSID